MKKLIFNIIAIGTIFMLSSCADYLNVDKYFYDQLSLDSAFAKKIYVDGWLANAYEGMNFMAEFKERYRWGSDDLINPDEKAMQNGNYSADDPLDNMDGRGAAGTMYKVYESVRKASTFIENVGRCPELTLTEISDYTAQAHFLRAYAYWSLLRRYGPIPLIPKEGLDVNLSYETLSLPRSKFDDIINFINEDLELAAVNLPVRRTINNMGHPTKGAALTLRARVLLYAASPLFNGNTDLFNMKDNVGNQLINQTYDEGKWARAAAAAKDVMELNQYALNIIKPSATTIMPPHHPEYSDKEFPNGWADVDPYASYKSIFDGTILGSKNDELIFTRTNEGHNTIRGLVKSCIPRTLNGGNKIGVSQKMVDAYYMNDGRTIQEGKADGYYQERGFTTSSTEYPYLPAKVSLQYANREPRFYASIAYNGSIWECESANESKYRRQQLFYYKNENDGKLGFKEDLPLSGIGFKKFYNPEDALTTGGYVVNKTEPSMRYAEVLLIYAEALNELTTTHNVVTYNGTSTTISRDIEEMRYALKQIRFRAGLPDFKDDIYADQGELRTRIKRERQIEFLGENAFRFLDNRRWKDAMVEENMPLMGCNINISYDEDKIQLYYVPTAITSMPKNFEQKMYFFPIPTEELKRNVNMTQNPGWQ